MALEFLAAYAFAEFGQLLLLLSVVVSGDEYTHNAIVSQ